MCQGCQAYAEYGCAVDRVIAAELSKMLKVEATPERRAYWTRPVRSGQ